MLGKSVERADRPLLSDFSTDVALKANLNSSVGPEDDGNRVPVEQGFVQGILALVHPPLLILHAVSTPRGSQSVGGPSNGEGVDNRNVGHIQPPDKIGAILHP